MEVKPLGVWFPAIRAGSGADVFTLRLAAELANLGVRAEICWLPHRAEFMPWSVSCPKPPAWVDVVHINSWLPQRFIPRHLPVLATLHSCVHDPALAPYKTLVQAMYHHYWVFRCETAAIRSARAVTAVSQYAASQAEKVFACGPVIAIPNWIDATSFCSGETRAAPHTPFRLLFVGKMSKGKGVDLLPEIMRQLGPGFDLAYTGSADAFGRHVQLPANMRALGRLNSNTELVAAYRNSDALLFPTRFEGFGLVALEAQACGVPVIASRCTSLPEVVADGESGILCPVDDVGAFVAAAKSLRDCVDVWRRMRNTARERAENMFSAPTALTKYIQIYQQLAGKY